MRDIVRTWLADICTHSRGWTNFRSLAFQGAAHSTIESASYFDTRAAGNVTVPSWIAALLGGQVSNAGP